MHYSNYNHHINHTQLKHPSLQNVFVNIMVTFTCAAEDYVNAGASVCVGV